MDILDIHTHRMPVELGQAIQNCQPAEFDPLAGAYYSVGIHPWYLTPENLEARRAVAAERGAVHVVSPVPPGRFVTVAGKNIFQGD